MAFIMQQDSLKQKQVPAMTENGKIHVLIKEAWELICCYANHIQDRIMFNLVD